MDEDSQDLGFGSDDDDSPAQSPDADPVTELARYEVRLRRTERVRTVLQTRASLRFSAPERLVVRIRESLLVVDRPGPRGPHRE